MENSGFNFVRLFKHFKTNLGTLYIVEVDLVDYIQNQKVPYNFLSTYNFFFKSV